MADVILKRGSSTKLDSLPVEDGALIITKDTSELYTDVNGVRKSVGNVLVVNTLPSDGITNKIYFLTTDQSFYIYNGTAYSKATVEPLFATDDDIRALFPSRT